MTAATRSLRVSLAALGAAALLAACSSARHPGDENSPYYAVPAGARVALRQALVIAPEQVAVYIQNGKVVPWVQVNAYYPHCKFEVRDRRDREQTVNPDEFIVTRVVQEVVHMVQWGRWQTAAASIGIRVGDMDDGASVRTYATYLYLASDRQPQVFRLGCGHWAYPGTRYAEHLSIQQIRAALGEVLTLQIGAPRP